MKDSLYLFYKSFKYAFRGLIQCIKNERNFRFEITLFLFMIILKNYYNLSDEKNVLFFLSIGLVLCFEIVNTAIEALVNIKSKRRNHSARIAKDVAASAVLISCIIFVVVSYYIFWDIRVFKKIYCHLISNPLISIIYICLLIIGIYFIFIAFNNKDKGCKK